MMTITKGLMVPDLIDGERRYGQWAGNKKGNPEDKTKCIVEVCVEQNRWPTFHQCRRKRGHGPEGVLCKQHARILEGK